MPENENKSLDDRSSKSLEWAIKEYEIQWNFMNYLHDMQNRYFRFFWIILVAFFVTIYTLIKEEIALQTADEVKFILVIVVYVVELLIFLELVFLRVRQTEQMNNVKRMREYFFDIGQQIQLKNFVGHPSTPIEAFKFGGAVSVLLNIVAVMNSALISIGLTIKIDASSLVLPSSGLGIMIVQFFYSYIPHLLIWFAVCELAYNFEDKPK